VSGTLSSAAKGGAVTLRPLRPGDLGWVIGRHGALYAAEYGFDIGFEIVVADIIAKAMPLDAAREGAWIAERDGVALGSVFLVRQDDETAKLRLLIVDPEARGLGLGRLLAETAVAFARDEGYRRVTLWTMAMLTRARAIYASLGFTLVSATPNDRFGGVDEVWTLEF
jgi:GNAT superfamily N-acetyltransferase